MSALDPGTPESGKNFLSIIETYLSVGILGAVVGILWHMADICQERTWGQRIATLFVSASVGLVVGPIATILTPLFIPDASTEVRLAFGCMAAAAGSQGLAMIFRYLKKTHIVRLDIPEDINEVRRTMTPEERREHADNCPFTPDRYGGACVNCPKRKIEKD